MTTVELSAVEVANLPTEGTFWLVREGERDAKAEAMNHALAVELFTRPDLRWPESSPPAEFTQACAPCETCDSERKWSGVPEFPGCPDCRIELVGPCPTCLGKTGWHGRDVPRTGAHNADRWFPCGRCRADHYSAPTGAVTLGHAYAVGQPLPIVLERSIEADHLGIKMVQPSMDGNHQWHMGVYRKNAHGGYSMTPEFGQKGQQSVAHYGPPESLVGKWAVELRRA